ncbi:MAG: endonuclease domain-containing protein [Nitrospiria bacterium]
MAETKKPTTPHLYPPPQGGRSKENQDERACTPDVPTVSSCTPSPLVGESRVSPFTPSPLAGKGCVSPFTPSPLAGEGGDGGSLTVRSRQLRRHLTDAEQTLWRHLRLRQVQRFKFRRQQPFGPYIVDFVCLDARLIIELDGGHHMTNAEYDTERTAWLTAQDFRVLRFWNHEVLTAPEEVIQVIQEALESSPHLAPPPQGGRKLTKDDEKTCIKALTPSPLTGEGWDGG